MAARLRASLGQHSLAGAHAVNQDFHGAVIPAGHALSGKGIALAVADGISSSPVSQLASATAVRSFLDDYYATSEAWTVRHAARSVLAATNAWLHAQTLAGEGRFDRDRGHVCTFTGLVLKGRKLHLLHAGDSRAYRLHPRSLEQMSEDHRVWHGSESYLARALGSLPQFEVDYRNWSVSVGEIYLLATDGAFPALEPEAIHAALAEHADDLDAAAAQLTLKARQAGSTDDATIILLRIDELPDEDERPTALKREGLALPPPLAPGRSFEGFTILRELQVSARSHIHLARDEASGEQIVIKTPAVELRDSATHLDSFAFEEWVARRISSPHVIRPWRGERPRQHLFVAMEYIEGQTLAQWMIDHPQPSLEAVRTLISPIALALEALHRREMLHRDLRPENVMIRLQGEVKLIDLATVLVAGLAEAGGQQPAEQPGTLQYTAPECLAGAAPTPASEAFSLAALCYQMLCGQLPYGLAAARVRSPQDLRRLRYVPLRHHRPDLPPWLEPVFAAALSLQPARRPQVMSEFAHALRAPGEHYRAPRRTPLIERDPVLFWKCSCLLLALACLLLLGLRLLGR